MSSAEPRALRSLTRPFALLSLSLNFLRLPPTSPPPPLDCHRQSCLSHAKAPSLLWHGFSSSHLQSFLDFAFLSFHMEDIFYYSHPQDRKSLSTLLLPSGLSLSLSASQSFLNASFYPVYSFFWNLIPFFFPARPVSALDGLHSIKFCTILSPFRMGLTNPGRALGRSSLLWISRKLLTLSGIPPFFINSFRPASLLALLVGLNLTFLIGALAWSIKITKVVPFESVEAFRKDLFLALYFSPYSSMIFLLLCLLSSAALFTLTIWPFGPPPPRSPLRWRPHKDLCFVKKSSITINSKWANKTLETSKIMEALKKNDYPKWFLKRTVRSLKTKTNLSLADKKEIKTRIVLPYVPR